MEQFDIIIIGAGPGGYVAAIRAAQLGLKTAVAERGNLGGICLNWGCIPTKALLKSAQALHYAQNGAAYGFTAESVTADLESIVNRSRGVSATMNKGIEYLFKKNNITLLEGNAHINGSKEVVVEGGAGEGTYTASHIIIATGARPASLPFAPIDGEKIWSYFQALTPKRLPKSMVVMGSGAIGTEFSFFYNSLGVDVTLVEYMDRVLPIEDDDVSAQVSRSLRKAGIKVMVSTAVKSVTKGELCIVEVEDKRGNIKSLEAEVVLSAVGVVPNTEDLGLEALGIETNRGKIVVDNNYKTSVDGIYAIGDVIATPALAHVASAEAIRCVEAIAGHNPSPINYNHIPGCTYISPEVASVGLRERECKERGLDYKVGKFPFTASGKATAAGERDGFAKVIIDNNTGLLLGVHLVGSNVSEMIGGVVALMDGGVKAETIIKSIFPHPTMSEAINEAVANAYGESIHI